MSIFSFIQQVLFRKPFGIHSPFLYSFANECIFNENHYREFELLEQIRKELKNDPQQIEVTDYGKGPRFGQQRKPGALQPLTYPRKIGNIASGSLQDPRFCRLFFRMGRYLKPRTILELGTSLGLTTSYFALSNPLARVLSLEGCPQTAGVARNTIQKAGAQNVEILIGDFAHTLTAAMEKHPEFDLVYIDGDHSFEGVLRNFTTLSNHLHEHSVVIIDDIRWSGGMKSAWKQMVAWEKTTLALDLGKAGILFFNPALSKQRVRIGF